MKVRAESRTIRQKVIRVTFDFTRDELVALNAFLDKETNSLSGQLLREVQAHLKQALANAT